MTDRELMDALAAAAPGLGIAALERAGALALLTVRDASPLTDAPARARLLAAAALHGVRNVALELVDDDARSARLPRD